MRATAVWRSAGPRRPLERITAVALRGLCLVIPFLLVLTRPNGPPCGVQGARPVDCGVAAHAAAEPTPSEPPLWTRLDQAGGAPTAIALAGRVAVVGVAESAWMVDLTVDNQPRLIGRTPLLGGTIVDAAVIGQTAVLALGAGGIVLIDFSEPTTPVVGDRLDGQADTLAVSGDRAIVCGGSGCRIVRITAPADGTTVGTVAFQGTVGQVAARGSDAFIVVDGAAAGTGIVLHVVNIADPAGPQTLQTKSLVASPVRGLSVNGDWLWVLQDSGDLRAYDLSGDGPPTPRGGTRVPAGVQSTGVHPLAVAGDRAYIASGLEVSAIDVTQPTAPRFLGATPVDGLIAALAATSDRLYVANHADLLGGRRAFHGVEVLAAALESGPRTLGALDEAWSAYGVALHGPSQAVVAAGRSGLRIIDLDGPGMAREIGSWRAAAELVDVVVIGDVAYAADASNGAMVHLVDLSDPTLPRTIGVLREPATRANALVRVGRFVAVGLQPRQLALLDASDPRAPRLTGQVDLPGATMALASRGRTLFALTGRPQRWPTLVVLDVADDGTARVREALSLDLPLEDRSLFGLSVDGDTVLVGASGLVVAIDVAESPPREAGRVSLTHPAVGLFGAGGRAVAAGGGLSLIDFTDPAEPVVLATQAWPAAWPEVRNAVAVSGDRIVAAQWDAGLSIARIGPAEWAPQAPAEPPTPPATSTIAPPTSTPAEPTAAPDTPTPDGVGTDVPPATTAMPTPTTPTTPPVTSSPAPTASAPPATQPTAPSSGGTASAATPTPTTAPSSAPSVTAVASATRTARASSTPRPSAGAGRPVSIFLPLAVTESCPPRDVFTDIVLVVDASTSMAERTNSGQQKIDAALDAVWTFLDGLRLQGSADRAGIVVFNDVATTLQPLTSDRRKLVSALRRVALAPRSRVDLGITTAATELIANGRTKAVQAMIVLSDGKANPVAPSGVITAARNARQAGLSVFVVGIGPDMDAPTLRAMAGAATRYFPAPDADQLRPIYAALARTVPCPSSGYWSKR
ncbi:MAG: VWA domain-containing protein [Ardenticatenales bacterium]